MDICKNDYDEIAYSLSGADQRIVFVKQVFFIIPEIDHKYFAKANPEYKGDWIANKICKIILK